MKINQQVIERIIFRQYKVAPRFTQDSPVYPDVWMAYFKEVEMLHDYKVDLILTPHRKSRAAELFKAVYERLNKLSFSNNKDWRMASSGETVVARLTFFELINVVVPLSGWWKTTYVDQKDNDNWHWLKILVGSFLYVSEQGENFENDLLLSEPAQENAMHQEFELLFDKHFKNLYEPSKKEQSILYSISRNRPATITIHHSIGSTKADAGRRLFAIDGSEITWAVLDTGIDARNMAFRKTDPETGKPYVSAFGPIPDPNSNFTRIVETYDFTKFRETLATIHESENLNDPQSFNKKLAIKGNDQDRILLRPEVDEYIREISRALHSGRLLDWTVIAPLLRVPHNFPDYLPPIHPHGTHVAGIIGASDSCTPLVDPLVGMCPGIELYDIRVLNERGEGEEFNILAAIQFLRWLNNQKEGFMIHGANLSFSMMHEVASYACGQTPVCEACDRMVSEGTVIVAAAGNLGQTMYTSTAGISAQGFRMVNITDPGNAESVITVGSTHRNRPHTYGVSYFSSKGPTGDGRVKPDLVAPGEKIVSCVIGDGTDRMDGTSMAAPHVSGAAALLLAKHRELIGKPRRVKEILCKTATDLGREKYFQGCGLVDVLRAIQSV